MVAERDAGPARRAGRPRDPRVDERVLDAAASQLVQGGVRGLRMGAIADQTGVAKSTIYRRWPSRAHLIAAVLARGQQEIGTPNTGDIGSDLATFTTRLAAALDPPLIRQLAAELVAAVTKDADLAATVRTLWVDRRRQIADVIQNAIEDGQLRGDLQASIVVDQLAGALYYHVFVTGEPITDAYAERLVDSVLRGALED